MLSHPYQHRFRESRLLRQQMEGKFNNYQVVGKEQVQHPEEAETQENFDARKKDIIQRKEQVVQKLRALSAREENPEEKQKQDAYLAQFEKNFQEWDANYETIREGERYVFLAHLEILLQFYEKEAGVEMKPKEEKPERKQTEKNAETKKTTEEREAQEQKKPEEEKEAGKAEKKEQEKPVTEPQIEQKSDHEWSIRFPEGQKPQVWYDPLAGVQAEPGSNFLEGYHSYDQVGELRPDGDTYTFTKFPQYKGETWVQAGGRKITLAAAAQPAEEEKPARTEDRKREERHDDAEKPPRQPEPAQDARKQEPPAQEKEAPPREAEESRYRQEAEALDSLYKKVAAQKPDAMTAEQQRDAVALAVALQKEQATLADLAPSLGTFSGDFQRWVPDRMAILRTYKEILENRDKAAQQGREKADQEAVRKATDDTMKTLWEKRDTSEEILEDVKKFTNDCTDALNRVEAELRSLQHPDTGEVADIPRQTLLREYIVQLKDMLDQYQSYAETLGLRETAARTDAAMKELEAAAREMKPPYAQEAVDAFLRQAATVEKAVAAEQVLREKRGSSDNRLSQLDGHAQRVGELRDAALQRAAEWQASVKKEQSEKTQLQLATFRAATSEGVEKARLLVVEKSPDAEALVKLNEAAARAMEAEAAFRSQLPREDAAVRAALAATQAEFDKDSALLMVCGMRVRELRDAREWDKATKDNDGKIARCTAVLDKAPASADLAAYRESLAELQKVMETESSFPERFKNTVSPDVEEAMPLRAQRIAELARAVPRYERTLVSAEKQGELDALAQKTESALAAWRALPLSASSTAEQMTAFLASSDAVLKTINDEQQAREAAANSGENLYTRDFIQQLVKDDRYPRENERREIGDRRQEAADRLALRNLPTKEVVDRYGALQANKDARVREYAVQECKARWEAELVPGTEEKPRVAYIIRKGAIVKGELRWQKNDRGEEKVFVVKDWGKGEHWSVALDAIPMDAAGNRQCWPASVLQQGEADMAGCLRTVPAVMPRSQEVPDGPRFITQKAEFVRTHALMTDDEYDQHFYGEIRQSPYVHDCYLLASLQAIDPPLLRALIETSVKLVKDAGGNVTGYEFHIPMGRGPDGDAKDGQQVITVMASEMRPSSDARRVSGPPGWHAIEVLYSKVRAGDKAALPELESISEGYAETALRQLVRAGYDRSLVASSNNAGVAFGGVAEKDGERGRSAAQEFLRNFSNGRQIATALSVDANDQRWLQRTDGVSIALTSHHSYSIVGVETTPAGDIDHINLVNPYNTAEVIPVTFDEFCKHFRAIESSRLDYRTLFAPPQKP